MRIRAAQLTEHGSTDTASLNIRGVSGSFGLDVTN